MLNRTDILPEPELPDATELIAQGHALAQDWQVQPGAFLKHHGVACEAKYKRDMAADGRLMQHAQIGWRDPAKSRDAWADIYDRCAARNVTIDRYGICLDWSMGVPRDDRKRAMRGTGLILNAPEDFAGLTKAAPVAPHFGDFVLGFPASVENTCAALAAGATSIGNLGQYFTFRLQNHADDVACTTATLSALALISAQPVPMLVHSNLDDGFAALFGDLSSALGAVLLERHIGKLAGVEISHCWGHHFSDPVRRLAFHLALADVSDTPGTMIYGNTTSYRGSPQENFASLSSYLCIDIAGQLLKPTGHAFNPVPVTENQRIPDVDEVIEAQLFAARLAEHQRRHMPLLDEAPARALADRIVAGGRLFFDNAIRHLAAAGIATDNPFEMLLAIRRLGGRRLEAMCATGSDKIQSDIAEEVAEMSDVHLSRVPLADRQALASLNVRIVTATTDVHEHGKLVLDEVLSGAGATLIDGGTSAEPHRLAATAMDENADAIALSTYNGVAMSYYNALREHVGKQIPVLIGGRLNQVPDSSNTSLPVDVGDQLTASGALVCREIEDAVPVLLKAMKETK
ncbi:MAG: cobalamin-dependent protein [Pseudomonadota bacterium]